MSISPIPTDYDGCKFRSRKEARFAVMFRELGIGYEYEPQGFNLNGHRNYLPDFFLPDLGLWVEVKGTFPTPDEFIKATLLAQNDGSHPVVLTWENFTADTSLDNIFFWHDEDGVFHSRRGWQWLAAPERGWAAARSARFDGQGSQQDDDYDYLPY